MFSMGIGIVSWKTWSLDLTVVCRSTRFCPLATEPFLSWSNAVPHWVPVGLGQVSHQTAVKNPLWDYLQSKSAAMRVIIRNTYGSPFPNVLRSAAKASYHCLGHHPYWKWTQTSQSILQYCQTKSRRIAKEAKVSFIHVSIRLTSVFSLLFQ